MACNLMSRHQTSAVDLKFLQIVCTHVKELQIQNRTRSHRLASIPWIPKFAHECAAKECELRNRDTRSPYCATRRHSVLSRNLRYGTAVSHWRAGPVTNWVPTPPHGLLGGRDV